MDAPTVKEVIDKRPFHPFALHLADGRTMPVLHPENATVFGRYVLVLRDNGAIAMVEPFMIVSIEPVRNGNGHKPRRRGRRRK